MGLPTLDRSVDDVLNDYRNWILKVAWEYADNLPDVHDLAQEGHIAMWKALQKWEESKGVKLSTHLMNHARWRMAEVRQRGTFTGKPSAAGKKYSAGTGKNAGREVATDYGVSDFDIESVSREQAEAVMVAYHHGEIMAALNQLRPDYREKVLEWFWRNGKPETGQSWWKDKKYGVKWKLRAELAHLEELV